MAIEHFVLFWRNIGAAEWKPFDSVETRYGSIDAVIKRSSGTSFVAQKHVIRIWDGSTIIYDQVVIVVALVTAPWPTATATSMKRTMLAPRHQRHVLDVDASPVVTKMVDHQVVRD
jgi:hypothetical protein